MNDKTMKEWFNLSDDEREKYIKLAQGCIVLVKLHHESDIEIATYLFQYVRTKEGK